MVRNTSTSAPVPKCLSAPDRGKVWTVRTQDSSDETLRHWYRSVLKHLHFGTRSRKSRDTSDAGPRKCPDTSAPICGAVVSCGRNVRFFSNHGSKTARHHIQYTPEAIINVKISISSSRTCHHKQSRSALWCGLCCLRKCRKDGLSINQSINQSNPAIVYKTPLKQQFSEEPIY